MSLSDPDHPEVSLNTPVLLIAWRRPYTNMQAIEAIRAVALTRMLLTCDVANHEMPADPVSVAAILEVIECHNSDINQVFCFGPIYGISFISRAC